MANLPSLTMHFIMTDENPTITVGKVIMKNEELTAMNENVTTTNASLSIRKENQTVIKEDLSETHEKLRNTRKTKIYSIQKHDDIRRLRNLGRWDCAMDASDRKPNLVDEPDYHNFPYHKPPSRTRISSQHVYAEVSVNSCESQSSIFYQSLDTSIID